MVVGFLYLIGLAFLYVLPTVIAIGRSHPSAGGIAAVNAFLGWTLLGWVAALAWALSAVPSPPPPRLDRHADQSPPALGPPPPPSPPPTPNPPPSTAWAAPTERIYPSFVAGLAYADPSTGIIRADYARDTVREDDELLPRREYDNPHDPKAVLLLHQRFALGYVPRRHDWVADAIDDGKTIRIFVTRVADDDQQHFFVATEVIVTD